MLTLRLDHADTWKLVYLLSQMPEPAASDLSAYRVKLLRLATNAILNAREQDLQQSLATGTE